MPLRNSSFLQLLILGAQGRTAHIARGPLSTCNAIDCTLSSQTVRHSRRSELFGQMRQLENVQTSGDPAGFPLGRFARCSVKWIPNAPSEQSRPQSLIGPCRISGKHNATLGDQSSSGELSARFSGRCAQLLQLRVFCFGLSENVDIGVRVFPDT